jgi:superfamily II DNA or RNA helicase
VLVEHQLDAVSRASLVIERCGGVILADEPGLGKSFIAAQLAAIEERRGGAVDLIVPASLLEQWRATLREFGVSGARIATHDGLVTDPFLPEPRRRLIVVDEAHAFRNPKTQRYDALARRSVGARMLLVTATPVCNSARDLEALVSLFAADDDLAARGVPSIDVAFESGDGEWLTRIVRELVIRRGRSVLPPRLQFGGLEQEVVRHPVFGADGAVGPMLDALRFPLVGDRTIVRQFLWRRLESSEAALLESLRRQRRFYERALECLASGRALPKAEYRRAFGHEEDAAAFQQVLFWDMFAPAEAAADVEEISTEMRRIDDLRACVEASPRNKRAQLKTVAAATNEPVLVFTGWAATAVDLLSAIAPLRPTVLATGRDRKRASEAIAAFRSGKADVLIATDLVAEGLNLQRAGVVVHYDLPWNPVKVDQRNGRAHRIGQQRRSVRAVYFLPEEDRAGVLRVVSAKNETRARLLTRMEAPPFVLPSAALRPRVTNEAAAVRLSAALERVGRRLPEELARRHKAGIERLLDSLGRESLDDRKLCDISSLLELEPWGRPGLL